MQGKYRYASGAVGQDRIPDGNSTIAGQSYPGGHRGTWQGRGLFEGDASIALADVMRAGSMAVACLVVVPDWPALGRNAEGAFAAVRSPESRELYRYHLDRLAGMDELVAGGRRN